MESADIGKLMHDFSCINPDDTNYEALAGKARYFKQDEKGHKRSGSTFVLQRSATTR